MTSNSETDINMSASTATAAALPVKKIIRKKEAAPKAAPKAAPEVDECNICCDPFNKSNHLPIVCEHGSCQYKMCSACVRAYLLTSTNEPHCMECKQPWSAKFVLVLSKKWMAETYRPHRERMILDIELSKMADTMKKAEQYKEIFKERIFREKAAQQIRELKLHIEHVNREIQHSLGKCARLRRGDDAEGGDAAAATERNAFFMPCSVQTCNGMLSTQYKCGICDNYTCNECHETIGPQKTGEHTCNPDNVASAQAIKKETKQCPGCHNRIYRAEGCSQMWCTGCHTAFDWNTGRKVVSGTLHNPHWLEYQRNLNNGAAPRAPGDVPCGGLCTYSELSAVLRKLPLEAPHGSAFSVLKEHENNAILRATLNMLFRLVQEITANRVRELREQCQTMRDFEQLRVRYIVGEISKAELSAAIFKQDKAHQKNTELVHVFELLGAVGIDLFRNITMSKTKGSEFKQFVEVQLDEYNVLRMHCNALFATISNTYNLTVPQISEKWVIYTHKFSGRGMLSMTKKADASAAAQQSSAAAGAGPSAAGAQAEQAQAQQAQAQQAQAQQTQAQQAQSPTENIVIN